MLQAEIMPVYKNKKGIVTIVSDDGVFSTAKVLNEYCKIYNVPITVAGTVRNIIPHLLFWSKKKNDLLELVNHSYNHIRMEEGRIISSNEKKLKHEIVDSKAFIEKITGKKCIAFVCPENQMCQKGYKLLKETGYCSVAQGSRGYNELSFDKDAKNTTAGSWYNLRRMGIRDKSDDLTKMRETWVNYTIDNNKWLIEMWHNVNDDIDKGYQTITLSEAKQHLEYIKSHEDDVWIASLSDATKYIKEKQHAIVKAWYHNGKIGCYIDFDEPLDEELYRQELTIKIDGDNLPDRVGDRREYFVDLEPRCIKRISVR